MFIKTGKYGAARTKIFSSGILMNTNQLKKKKMKHNLPLLCQSKSWSDNPRTSSLLNGSKKYSWFCVGSITSDW